MNKFDKFKGLKSGDIIEYSGIYKGLILIGAIAETSKLWREGCSPSDNQTPHGLPLDAMFIALEGGTFPKLCGTRLKKDDRGPISLNNDDSKNIVKVMERAAK